MTLRTAAVLAFMLVCTPGAEVPAQTPTGTLSGRVEDRTAGPVAGATVSITSEQTGDRRTIVTVVDGLFIAAALQPGFYRIVVEAAGFRRADRRAQVEAGTTLIVDVTLDVGPVQEHVNVIGVQPLLRRDHHQVGGVVTREQIDRLPLNGRNVLDLARVEPGVIPSRLPDGRIFVSSLGAGLQTIPRIGTTRVTVDGANVTTPGTAGVLLQISPDAVQEFQIATVNFDPATSATTNGAINIVTRSGSNNHQGSGFYLFRNSALAAYPALSRDPNNPHPFFERHQFGLWTGGPVRRGRAFYFGNVERTRQTGVVTIELPEEFAPLGGIFDSPYTASQLNARGDVRLHARHAAFFRHTADRNRAFGPLGLAVLPSSWSERFNFAHQTIAGATSVLSDRAVNELRASYFSTSSDVIAAGPQSCGGCFGLGEVRTVVQGVRLIYGGQGPTSSASGWRFHLSDTVTWQKGRHSVRFGGEWDHDASTSSDLGVLANELTVYSPREARELLPGLPLPVTFATPDDILRLPARDIVVTVGSGSPLWEGFRPDRRRDFYRLHVADTWRPHAQVVLNAGLGWSYEPNALPRDLTKPRLLVPILGETGLGPPKPPADSFSPSIGFAWMPNGKTVVRGGGGRYVDPAGSANTLNLARERHLLSPLGTGSLRRTGANLQYDGRALNFPVPTSFTGTDLLQLLPALRLGLEGLLNPNNRDLSVRNLDSAKEGRNLQDPRNTAPCALHVSLGLQRELGHGVVVSGDVTWKRFLHTFINGIDFNRWNSREGPVIPRCTLSQIGNASAACSTGPMYFDTSIGRARYLGLLLRAEKRFSGRTQLLASYALGSFVGSNGAVPSATSEASAGRVTGFNNHSWFENYGPLPTDVRHTVNVSGTVELPLGFQIALNTSAYSAPPFAASVGSIDFNGDGTTNDLLPGTRINEFGRDLNQSDLVRLVDAYNRVVAGTRTPAGRTAPTLTLPQHFSFNDGFFTQDVRVTRSFDFNARRRVNVFVEVFNVFNTANLVNFGSDLTQPASFGRPTARFGQAFGSGGPRALQLGAQMKF